jgi:orotidine-5'-phosphate decarboxylase
MTGFREMLEARWNEGKFVCVGLDTEYEKIPQSAYGGSIYQTLLGFNIKVVTATHDLVCAYKLNSAFYEASGPDGYHALGKTIDLIHRTAPGVPIILDAKRGDIENTNKEYSKAAFGGIMGLNADAITINPYLGEEANAPFLEIKDRGIIILCRTSNIGAPEFQDRLTQITREEFDYLGSIGQARIVKTMTDVANKTSHNFVRLFEAVAIRVARFWNKNDNCALVVGATSPQELATVRSLVGNLPLLIPGIGK